MWKLKTNGFLLYVVKFARVLATYMENLPVWLSRIVLPRTVLKMNVNKIIKVIKYLSMIDHYGSVLVKYLLGPYFFHSDHWLNLWLGCNFCQLFAPKQAKTWGQIFCHNHANDIGVEHLGSGLELAPFFVMAHLANFFTAWIWIYLMIFNKSCNEMVFGCQCVWLGYALWCLHVLLQ